MLERSTIQLGIKKSIEKEMETIFTIWGNIYLTGKMFEYTHSFCYIPHFHITHHFVTTPSVLYHPIILVQPLDFTAIFSLAPPNNFLCHPLILLPPLMLVGTNASFLVPPLYFGSTPSFWYPPSNLCTTTLVAPSQS